MNRPLRDPEVEQVLVSMAQCLMLLCGNSSNYSQQLVEAILKVNNAIERLQARQVP